MSLVLYLVLIHRCYIFYLSVAGTFQGLCSSSQLMEAAEKKKGREEEGRKKGRCSGEGEEYERKKDRRHH
jgi:hypothetical protein